MSPWSFTDLLASDVFTWAATQAAVEGAGIPASVYLERLAQQLGITRHQLYRYMSGEAAPSADTLTALCRMIGSARAVAALAELCGLRVCATPTCRAVMKERTSTPAYTAPREENPSW